MLALIAFISLSAPIPTCRWDGAFNEDVVPENGECRTFYGLVIRDISNRPFIKTRAFVVTDWCVTDWCWRGVHL